MAKERVRVSKVEYRRDVLSKVLDTNFTTFTQPVEESGQDTIEELFRLYDKLYFNIPKEGQVNSHQYLIKKSSELVNFEKSTEEIQPLLDEIAQLRQQLLEANTQIFELENRQ